MTVEALLSRLQGVHKSGARWIALCPAHDDRCQSLSVGVGEDRRILLTCHAGCSVEAIVIALGLTMRDLFPADNGDDSRRIVATYPYHDEAGTLLYEVVRFAPKDFRQRRPDGRGGWVWNLDGVRRVLYRLPELKGHHTVYVPEGEKDVDRLRALGLPATCNPGGAGKWRSEYAAEQLQAAGVEQVVILGDNDRPGEAHALHMARSCFAAGLGVKRPRLPGFPPLREKHGEDLSDWLDAGHTAEELAALVEATPEVTAEDLESQAPPAAGPVLVRVAEVEAEEVAWLWPGRLAAGKLTLLIGDPGVGKSLLTLDAAARLSRGLPWPGGGVAPQGDVILLSAEDGLADTVRPRLEAAGADLDRVHVLSAVRDEAGERPFCLAGDLPVLERAVTETRARLVVIDPASAYLGNRDSYKDAEVRALLAPLAVLAERHGVAVIAVMHLGKAEQRRPIYRALGSVAFVAAARIVLAVAKDPEDSDRRMVVAVKNNLAPPAATLAFKIAPSTTTEVPTLAWERDPVAGADADRLLGPGPSADERAEGQEAADFLLEILAVGRVKAEEVLKAARKAGIAERTLYRAKRQLGVKSTHDGPPGIPGPWYWVLPETATEAAISGQVATSVQPGGEKAKSAAISTEIAIPGDMAISGGNLRDEWGEV